MRRIQVTAAVVLGLALAVLPGAGYAADQPSSVPFADDCVSTTETKVYDGVAYTVTTDPHCFVLTDVTAESTLPTTGAPAAVPVAGRPAFTG